MYECSGKDGVFTVVLECGYLSYRFQCMALLHSQTRRHCHDLWLGFSPCFKFTIHLPIHFIDTETSVSPYLIHVMIKKNVLPISEHQKRRSDGIHAV